MKKYLIKTAGKNFYEIYPIKAENLFFAKILAFNKFVKSYPSEKKHGITLKKVTGTIPTI